MNIENREPKFEEQPEPEKPEEEREQSPEEILKILEQAAEKSEVRLTVLNSDGKESREGIVVPAYVEGNVLWVTTEKGEGIAIEISRIKKAELSPDKSTNK